MTSDDIKKNEKNIVISYETIVTILLPSLIDVLKRKGPMVRAKKNVLPKHSSRRNRII